MQSEAESATKRRCHSATALGIGLALGLFGGVWLLVVAEARKRFRPAGATETKCIRHSATSTY